MSYLTEHEAWTELLEGVKAGVPPSDVCRIVGCTYNHISAGMCVAIEAMEFQEVIAYGTFMRMQRRIIREVNKKQFKIGQPKYLAPEGDWNARISYLEKFVRETKPKRRTK